MQNKKQHIRTNGGQAMIIAVLFFLFSSLSIIAGIVAPVTREFSIARSTLYSHESYYLAESGLEDALYRLKNNKQTSASETLAIDDHQVVTTITDNASNQKEITSLGNVYNRERKVRAKVRAGIGAAFHYGIQSGQGGFVMNNGSSIIGNAYSNGSITGSGTITGSAVAANSSALAANQSNGSGTPTSSMVFGNANTTQDVAQSFVVSTASPLNKAKFYIKKTGTPSNTTVRVVSNSGGSPSTTVVASGTLSASLITTSYGWAEVSFTSNPILSTSSTYWLVIDGTTSSSNYYTLGANSSYSSGTAKIGQYTATWNVTSPSGLDAFFEVYLGGLNSTIDGITVGSNGVGIAHAHTVNNSTVAGNLYCQTGSGNNKACNTTQADPPSITMPMSDASIQELKDQAIAGGTISGNYVPAGASSTLGPKYITGNLSMTNGHILTITGTVYVAGTVTFSNGSEIHASPSVGANSVVLISDSTVDISNNVQFYGDPSQHRYVMVFTTSDCPKSPSCGSTNALTASNNVGTVILNAQNGTILFNNNSSANEAAADKIILSNNVTITYDSGVTNVNFVSGPGGAWNLDAWEEIE